MFCFLPFKYKWPLFLWIFLLLAKISSRMLDRGDGTLFLVLGQKYWNFTLEMKVAVSYFLIPFLFLAAWELLSGVDFCCYCHSFYIYKCHTPNTLILLALDSQLVEWLKLRKTFCIDRHKFIQSYSYVCVDLWYYIGMPENFF